VSAPTVPFPTNLELLTPTGAAILTCLATFEQPAMRLHTVGYGAGSRAEPSPNLLRVLIGTSLAQASGSGDAEETLWMLECNLDDMNPQWIGHLFERLLDAGALDVTSAPVLMKKGRPGQLLSVLCRHDGVASATEILLTETTTLGVRRHAVARFAAERTMYSVATPFGEVPVKLRILHGLVTQATPEYEACRELALRLGVPLPLISQAAQAAAQPLLAQPPPRDGTSSGP
jgi:uncharacterized protein (DUF111 family)